MFANKWRQTIFLGRKSPVMQSENNAWKALPKTARTRLQNFCNSWRPLQLTRCLIFPAVSINLKRLDFRQVHEYCYVMCGTLVQLIMNLHFLVRVFAIVSEQKYRNLLFHIILQRSLTVSKSKMNQRCQVRV